MRQGEIYEDFICIVIYEHTWDEYEKIVHSQNPRNNVQFLCASNSCCLPFSVQGSRETYRSIPHNALSQVDGTATSTGGTEESHQVQKRN